MSRPAIVSKFRVLEANFDFLTLAGIFTKGTFAEFAHLILGLRGGIIGIHGWIMVFCNRYRGEK